MRHQSVRKNTHSNHQTSRRRWAARRSRESYRRMGAALPSDGSRCLNACPSPSGRSRRTRCWRCQYRYSTAQYLTPPHGNISYHGGSYPSRGYSRGYSQLKGLGNPGHVPSLPLNGGTLEVLQVPMRIDDQKPPRAAQPPTAMPNPSPAATPPGRVGLSA